MFGSVAEFLTSEMWIGRILAFWGLAPKSSLGIYLLLPTFIFSSENTGDLASSYVYSMRDNQIEWLKRGNSLFIRSSTTRKAKRRCSQYG
jgi:hypothetical protein